MVFENDDEFGVQSYRDDVSYISNTNSVIVKLIKKKQENIENLKGDFLGIQSDVNPDEELFIDINIMSDNPDSKKLEEEGYTGKGVITYSCYCSYDTNIKNHDLIEFVDGYGYNIEPGQKFKIELEDEGLFMGQYCFKHFNITLI